jgi:hypothetical protein
MANVAVERQGMMGRLLSGNRFCWTANLFSFVVLTLVIAAVYKDVLFFRFDGTFILQVAEEQNRWLGFSPNLNQDFLKGIGDLQMPILTRLLPSFALSSMFDGHISPYFAFCFSVITYFAAAAYLCVCLGAPAPHALAAAWLGCLLTLPYFVPPLTTVKLWGSPHTLAIIAELVLAGGLFIGIGRNGWLATVMRAAAVFVLYAHIIVAAPAAIILGAPVAVLVGVVALFDSRDRRELLQKLVFGVVIAGGLAILFVGYIRELFLFNPETFFWNNMNPSSVSPWEFSFFTHPGEQAGKPGMLVFALAVLGVLVEAARGRGDLRHAARGYLAFISLLAAIVAGIYLSADAWRGPALGYIDMCALPIFSLFLVYGILAVARALRPVAIAVGQRVRSLRATGPWLRQERAAAVLLAAVPWVALVFAHDPYASPGFHAVDPFIWPPKQTPLVADLANAISLQRGHAFHGRVATLAGISGANPVGTPGPYRPPFDNQHAFDAIDLYYTGNEHRYYGLWYYDIPTLQTVSQFVSPFFTLFTAHFLNPPNTVLEHQHVTLSKFDARILQLLGAAYEIDDRAIEAPNVTLDRDLKVGDARGLHLYRLSQPNIGDYSPVEMRAAQNARDILAIMDDPTVDFRRVYVAAGPNPAPLVPATQGRITIERDGLRVTAQSEGKSVLVLPVEYSHCLDLTVNGGDPRPTLFRADLLLAGLTFAGDIDVNLSYRFGPFENRGCRNNDLGDAYAMGLDTLPIWPAAR